MSTLPPRNVCVCARARACVVHISRSIRDDVHPLSPLFFEAHLSRRQWPERSAHSLIIGSGSAADLRAYVRGRQGGGRERGREGGRERGRKRASERERRRVRVSFRSHHTHTQTYTPRHPNSFSHDSLPSSPVSLPPSLPLRHMLHIKWRPTPPASRHQARRRKYSQL